MSFEKRAINVNFQLGEGDMGKSTGNANGETLKGLRISARIIKAGGPSMGTAQLQIWGMTRDQMNRYSTLGQRPTTVRKNQITVDAGVDDGQGGGVMSTVFIGNITNAWFDGSSPARPVFQVLAHVGGFDAVNPVAPTSYKGSVDVATILSGLATKMGKTFENNGVSVQISNPYFAGSAREQALAAVRAAGINWNGLDDNKLAIWPNNGSRGGAIPLISKDTGMENYPSFTSQGVVVSSLFNQSVGFGSKIQVKSGIVDGANGQWIVYALNYELDARLPKGRWHMTMSAARPGFAVVA